MAQQLLDLIAPGDSLPAGGLKINENFTELYSVKLDASGYTAADVLTKIKTVDGAGSGLDADLLDGISSAGYATTAALALKLDASAYTAADVLTKLLAVDGVGSGLDADMLDGISSAGFFQTASVLRTVDGAVGAPAWSFASDTDSGVYRVSGNNFAFAGGGVQVMRVQLGGTTRAVTIGDGTNSAAFAFDAAAGGNRDISLQSAGVNRWVWRVNATAEAGSNAGSDFDILRRDDAGASLGTAVRLMRSSGQWLFEDGSAAAPELSFLSDPDCGLYRVSANALGLAAGGTDVIRVVTTGIDMAVSDAQMKKTTDSGRWILCGGSANNAANGANIRVEGIDYLGAGLGGAISLITTAGKPVSISGTTSQLRIQDGSVALPGLAFSADTDCGLYRIGTNQIGLGCNATNVLDLSTALVAINATTVRFNTTTATTIGAAGGAAALPATPLGYLTANVNGTAAKIPYYSV